MQTTARRFGVEIECYVPGTSFNDAADRLKVALDDMGLDAYVAGYTHNVVAQWKIVPDGSLRSADVPGCAGVELVSPILKGVAGMDQLQKACAALANVGAKVTKTTGLHVHHEMRDMNWDQMFHLFDIYAAYEDTIDSWMAPSRRGDVNQYCHGIKNDYNWQHLIRPRWEWLPRSFKRLVLSHGRYHKLNITSYPKYGTIEFRQHGGTIEFEKIARWVIFGQTLLAATKRGATVNYNGSLTFNTLASTIGLDTETTDFFRNRIAHFARREARVAAR